MYPASRLVRPDHRSPVLPKLLSLVAALVLLLGFLEVFYVYKPKPAHLVQFGMPVTGCAIRFGPGPAPGDPLPPGYHRDLCHLVVPNQHVPERVGIGAASIVVVVALMGAAAGAARKQPAVA
jgi:hypothetical protein